MNQIQLIKSTTKSGKNIYRATKDGEVVYKSAPTYRDYVAMIINVPDQTCSYRFGRPDLIGKGGSKHLFNANPEGYYLAVID